jgi:hypothetical protein
MSRFRHKKPYQLSYTRFTESVCVVLQRTRDAAAGPPRSALLLLGRKQFALLPCVSGST